MKTFCCACGRPVPMRRHDGKWVVGHCPVHPKSKRYTEAFAARQFEAMREAFGCGTAQMIADARAVRRRAVRVEEILREVFRPLWRRLRPSAAVILCERQARQ